MNLDNIKAVTIDFWNTLFDSSNGTKRNEYRMDVLLGELQKFNLKIDNEEFERGVKASWEYFNHSWLEKMRTPSTIETINYFWKYLNLPYDLNSIEIVSNAFSESILFYPPKLLEGVPESLALLSKKFKLALISDTGFSPGKVLRRLLYENDIIEYFSAFSFSDETGVAKPHPKAFSTILDEFEIAPEQAVHIGDIEETDIVGAKKINMSAIKFTGDKTRILGVNNSGSTISDYELSDWYSITDLLLNK